MSQQQRNFVLTFQYALMCNRFSIKLVFFSKFNFIFEIFFYYIVCVLILKTIGQQKASYIFVLRTIVTKTVKKRYFTLTFPYS